MRDKITLDRIKKLHPKLITEVEQVYDEIVQALGDYVTCRFSHTLRTNAEQNQLYAQGRTILFNKSGKRLGIVTNAKGGNSYHNYGLAIDIVLLVDRDRNGSFETARWNTREDVDKDGKSDWMEVVAIFKKYGWEWGGDWKRFPDMPHFQKTFGLSIARLKELTNNKGGVNFIIH